MLFSRLPVAHWGLHGTKFQPAWDGILKTAGPCLVGPYGNSVAISAVAKHMTKVSEISEVHWVLWRHW
ncbi:hypothetical protein PG989_009340 [Apiospora arundinis]